MARPIRRVRFTGPCADHWGPRPYTMQDRRMHSWGPCSRRNPCVPPQHQRRRVRLHPQRRRYVPSWSSMLYAQGSPPGVRATIEAGNITVGEVLTSFPFGNAVTEVTFTGADLWKIFEGVASQVNQWNNKAVTSTTQVSKEIRFTYNPDNAVGSRLISLSIKNQSISSQTTDKFTIVTWSVSLLEYVCR